MKGSLLLLPLLLASGTALAGVARTEIVARFDPTIHRIEASATLDVGAGKLRPIRISSRLQVREVACDGRKIAFEVTSAQRDATLSLVSLHPEGWAPIRCTFRYDGEIHDPPKVAQFSRETIADETRGTIEPAGVFLSPEAVWYPRVTDAPSSFRLEVQLPAGWDAVAEGSEKLHEPQAQGIRLVFESARPIQGLHLVAAPWKRVESEHHGTRIAAFVFPEDQDLAEPYIAGVKRYLDLYGEWLGPHAYDRFSVVENFFSTGYGMPSFTVLGQDVMRLPFIVDTSLGHEVAHDWWGNGVFVDEAGGNWSEGLTTFVADYHYKRLQGDAAAAEYRREVCRDYTNYVAEAGSDFPLSQFRERTTSATRAVGYGKTMMVFHMLERRLGKERFDRVLRRVYRENLGKEASWETWRAAFSDEARENLGWYFEQWVRRPGAPSLALGSFAVKELSPGAQTRYEVTGTLLQQGGAWRLDVPLLFEGEGKSERIVLELAKASTPVHALLSFRPERLEVDAEQDVFRRLDPAEMPAVLSRVLGDSRALLVVDDLSGDALRDAYRELALTLTQSGMGEVVELSKLLPGAIEDRNVFLLGLPVAGAAHDLLARLPAEVRLDPEGFTLQGTEHREPGATLLVVARHPRAPTCAVALFEGKSADAVRAAGKKLVHYGKYSYLAFVDGKNQAKAVARVEGGPLQLRFGP